MHVPDAYSYSRLSLNVWGRMLPLSVSGSELFQHAVPADVVRQGVDMAVRIGYASMSTPKLCERWWLTNSTATRSSLLKLAVEGRLFITGSNPEVLGEACVSPVELR